MALVSGVMAASTRSGSRHQLSGKMSTNTGLAPKWTIGAAVAIQWAGIDPRKVFPHSLRHLFARVFYSVEKDLLRLADILGHASVNTTRIYTMETGRQHMKLLERVSRVLLT